MIQWNTTRNMDQAVLLPCRQRHQWSHLLSQLLPCRRLKLRLLVCNIIRRLSLFWTYLWRATDSLSVKCNNNNNNQAHERVQALADISHSRCVVITTQPVHQLQICPIVHNLSAPLPFPKLHPGPGSSVGMRRWTDTQICMTTIHFASPTTHEKCNNSNRQTVV